MNHHPWLNRLSVASIMLAFCVILLGAYTRLSDAGLGCPDWPGCYGQLTAPSETHEIASANNAFPQAPVDISKARTEMTHRYFAESLGSLIVLFALIAYWKRRSLTLPLWLPGALVALVIAQGILGMWTVTLKLVPLIVLSHLVGGFCTLSLLMLCWLFLRLPNVTGIPASPTLSRLGLATLAMLVFQILLGGWTSANYAALICPDFPLCQGKWFPHFSARAFNVLGAFGIKEPLAFMDAIEKTTIHVTHRLGASITLALGIALSIQLMRLGKKVQNPQMRRLITGCSHGLAFLLFVQCCLGISNILMHLPIGIAVAHNGIAAMLLLTLVTINYILFKARSHS